MDKIKNLIDKITAIELKMFLAVQNDGTGNCQEYPEAFLLHRKAQFCIWSLATLTSYHNDLLNAQKADKNLMTVKYGCIQGLFPLTNASLFIDRIIEINMDWQEEMILKYPTFMSRARPLDNKSRANEMVSFKKYVRGELETYSAKTLQLLYEDLQKMKSGGINGSESIYTHLVKSYNFTSLEAAERQRGNP